MKAETMAGAERRQFGRRQTRVHASIALRGRPSMLCVMCDVSETGALLEVSHPEWLPTRFRLIVEAFGIESDCEVVRRTATAVGVRFGARITSHLG
jgi:PilZ domain